MIIYTGGESLGAGAHIELLIYGLLHIYFMYAYYSSQAPEPNNYIYATAAYDICSGCRSAGGQ